MGAPLAHIVAGVALLVAGASAPVVAYAQASPWDGFTLCAVEYGVCSAPPGAVVRFGSAAGYSQATVTGNDGIGCGVMQFGSDPAAGFEKVCAYILPDQPTDPNGDPNEVPGLPNTQLMAWAVVACWATAWGIKVLARGLFT